MALSSCGNYSLPFDYKPNSRRVKKDLGTEEVSAPFLSPPAGTAAPGIAGIPILSGLFAALISRLWLDGLALPAGAVGCGVLFSGDPRPDLVEAFQRPGKLHVFSSSLLHFFTPYKLCRVLQSGAKYAIIRYL